MEESPEFQELPQIRVKWRIKNFWDLSTKDEFCLRSPSFSLSDTNWHISIYPNGHEKNNSKGCVGLYLSKEKSHKEHYVDFNIGIKSYDGTVFKALHETYKFKIGTLGWGFSSFIERLTLRKSNAVSPDGTLTIFCSAAIVEESLLPLTKEVASQTSSLPTTVEAMETASQTLYSNGTPTLIENFKDLYLSKRFADVKITVKDTLFFAHKNVLTSRSTVFSSMFNSDMKEKLSGKVEITDCDPDTFEEFLLFLYTGKLDMVTPSNAPSLYNTADKYDVQELKRECVLCMTNELAVDSFCDVLRLAAIYDETDLLEAATAFFIENAKQILMTIKWQNFSVENPSLGNELFLKFVNKHT